VHTVIITMGELGLFVSDGRDHAFIPAVRVEAVDTTGAGDAFNGGLASCIARGVDVFSAARYAAVVAGLSVTRRGTLKSMPNGGEVDDYLKEHNISLSKESQFE
jgi:ribokinase